jgi:GxxExxY protein
MRYGESTSEEIEWIATAVVDCAFKVHAKVGPGLLESIYEICLAHELSKAGFHVERQVKLPIKYDGIVFEAGLVLDLLVNKLVIVEIKSVELMNPVFEAQILSHLKLLDLPLGLLINFNVALVKDGIKRIILSKRRTLQHDQDF